MDNFKSSVMTGEIASAMKLCSYVKWFKVILAVVVSIAYLVGSAWLAEILIVAVVTSLILPLGFFDVFIQKLLEYNTQLLEERIHLNTNEPNVHLNSKIR
ncbi:hypothetical protein EKG38_06095 [Shewanella canadensis]|uniref:Uncharacterized protein n=2 Tax=Shewanella TaxID=22 RepID=A0A3S0KKV4_9GAMM|nr:MULTISPECIES: hypothetical protein [Shewanella]RTR33190.1 hypothetical protein EKG39_05420 [Shewanella atlantica]RTR40284.1 hypothetical protein EKG38_06095 [Shewanella canadensis]